MSILSKYAALLNETIQLRDEYRERYIAYMVKLGIDEKLAADDYDNGDQPDWGMEPEESASESMSYWENDS